MLMILGDRMRFLLLLVFLMLLVLMLLLLLLVLLLLLLLLSFLLPWFVVAISADVFGDGGPVTLVFISHNPA